MIIDNQIEPGTVFTLTIKADEANQRLDLYLTAQFKNYSRSFFKRLLTEGLITINGKEAKSGQILKKGEVLIVTFPKLPPVSSLKAFDTKLAVKVIAEEPNFLVIYKPAGLMVHKPNQYSEEVTLVDWLLASYKNLQGIGLSERPGIVHRLDKDTSGLLIVTRTNPAHAAFGDLFKNRAIEKVYWALVKGHPDRSGTIEFPIGRDQKQRNRMAHLPPGKSRYATTQYQVLAYYKDYSLVEVRLITGRTHQIRVHFAAIRHPVLGDKLYGESSKLIDRQALHAKKLAFDHEGKHYSYDYPVPEDMQKLIDMPVITSL